MLNTNLIFIKLGGSLITDKNQAETARVGLIRELLEQVRQFIREFPEKRILLGHGSGSFGHYVGSKYQTREGVFTAEQWLGYQQVWQSAHKLNQIVMEQAELAGLPVIGFPPSAAITTVDQKIQSWNLGPICSALEHGLMPVVFGDVVTDSKMGGTILSTEDLFGYLARVLHPSHIFLAGIEPGVFADFPQNTRVLETISPTSVFSGHLAGSGSIDVTGGMLAKVSLMQELVRDESGLQVRIFSALNPKDLLRIFLGEPLGTLIS